MKIALVGLLLLLPASSENLVPPEVVRLENVRIDGDIRIVTVGNANSHYSLICNVKTANCISPEVNNNYLLFNKNTRWKMPGGKVSITLAWLQDFTVKYNDGENIDLVPEQGGGMDQMERKGEAIWNRIFELWKSR